MLESLTARLRFGHHLTTPEITTACGALLDETVSLETRADFLRALRQKGETASEIAAFVMVLLDRAAKPALTGGGYLDVCGTGGDRAGLFNVSTAVMFVAAAAGAKVVKHGNRGITSKSGGADVLEALGIRIDLPPERAQEALSAAGCCFLFAPLYHPSFKAIGPVRKALADEGVTTIFNMLGPLLNPARPDFQLSGVFNPALLPVYAETFQLLGRKNAWAVHGAGGLDEVSTLGPTEVRASANEDAFSISPAALGLPPGRLEDLRGGDATENAILIEALLSGQERGAKRDLVVLNAAAALVVAQCAEDLPAGLTLAAQAIDSGNASATLERLRAVR